MAGDFNVFAEEEQLINGPVSTLDKDRAKIKASSRTCSESMNVRCSTPEGSSNNPRTYLPPGCQGQAAGLPDRLYHSEGCHSG